MPHIDVVDECPCRCNPQEIQYCDLCEKKACDQKALKICSIETPMIDLPLGATEDMVLGSIDFEAAVKTGASCFLPGVLARANRGILYIDEVNLLDDHLVDSILDAAESGFNIVEREGMSVWHPSRFILIGTMNPEEGDLRPQILDRFGLSVQVEAETDLSLRIELLKRREQFDLDPFNFYKLFHLDSIKISDKIVNARTLLSSVFIPNHLRTFITEICLQNNVAGHRADLAIERAACAPAALNGRIEVSSDDIIAVAPLALLHRIRNSQEPSMPPRPHHHLTTMIKMNRKILQKKMNLLSNSPKKQYNQTTTINNLKQIITTVVNLRRIIRNNKPLIVIRILHLRKIFRKSELHLKFETLLQTKTDYFGAAQAVEAELNQLPNRDGMLRALQIEPEMIWLWMLHCGLQLHSDTSQKTATTQTNCHTHQRL